MNVILIYEREYNKVTIGFINSNEELEYTTFIKEDGGCLEMKEDNPIEALIEVSEYENYEVYTLKEI